MSINDKDPSPGETEPASKGAVCGRRVCLCPTGLVPIQLRSAACVLAVHSGIWQQA